MGRHKEQLIKAFYHQVEEEIKNSYYHPRIKAKAVAESKGNEKLVESLYIKFRVEQLVERQTDKLWEMDIKARKKIRRGDRLIALLVLIIFIAIIFLIKNTSKYFTFPH